MAAVRVAPVTLLRGSLQVPSDKSLDFSELYDVRAFRVIVDDVKTCYAVLGIVHAARSATEGVQ